MNRCAALTLVVSLCLVSSSTSAQEASWQFLVSGDSRNCGDVVMPAIAKAAQIHNAAFYWHLGDFRAIYRFDQDYWQIHKPADPSAANIADYQANAWQDFIDNQLAPFGGTPVFLSLGNHEVIPPKTHDSAILAFADWFDRSDIRSQRLKDNPSDYGVRAYYHWRLGGIDFITLDNSTGEFESAQLAWVRRVLEADGADASVSAIVLGMHEALPESISASHSMNQTPNGEQSGNIVYNSLLAWKARYHKPIYVLASHSHLYMKGIFNTQYWRDHGGILPGWIIGAAGAERVPLPANSADAAEAKTMVYGYLLATVTPSKEDPIQFQFVQLNESDVPAATVQKFTADLIHACWVGNPAQSASH